MKRNKFFMLGIVTVLVAVLSLTFVSNTFAKYTSTVTGSDSATVAKWAWKYKNAEVNLTNDTVSFDLFNTIKDSNGTDDEGDVATNLIAPGTSGSFEISFENESEVTANLKVEFEENDHTVPIEFSLNADFSGAKNQLSDLDFTQNLAIGSAPFSKTIYWRWVFEIDGTDNEKESSNEIDTNLGITPQTVEVTMTVIFTQVD